MGIGDELGSVFKFAQQGIMQARKTEYPALPHILCRMQKVGRMFRKIGISGLHESFRFGRVGLTDNHCSNTKHVGLALIDGAIIGTRAQVTKDVPPYAVVAGNPGRTWYTIECFR